VNPVAQDKNRRDAPARLGDADRVSGAEDPRVVARRRVFLLLEAHRESLSARLRRRVWVRRRYEDLWLIKMVTRLQRDYLNEPNPGVKTSGGFTGVEYGIADWARPWGPTFLLQFQADLNVFDQKLKSCRRWLSVASQGAAEARAAGRFASLTSGMAAELKAAELTLPIWASRRLPSRRPAPGRAPRQEGRAAPHRGASKRASTARAQSKSGARGRRAAGARRDRKPSLNQVGFAELRSLKLSITQSRRVLAYRERVGGYESIDQLDDIPGFPEVVREQLKRRVSV
jgi:Helix-hairpin-helix motif